jgi:hypothetical protein
LWDSRSSFVRFDVWDWDVWGLRLSLLRSEIELCEIRDWDCKICEFWDQDLQDLWFVGFKIELCEVLDWDLWDLYDLRLV